MKHLIGWLRARLWLRPALLGATALAAALIALVSYETGALESLERQTVDTRFAIRGRHPPGQGVAIVAVDAKTVNALHAHLAVLPRGDYARLIDRLRRARPRLIGLDVVFEGESDPSDDRALLAAVARDGPVLLATHEDTAGSIPVPAGVPDARGAILASAAIDFDSDGLLRRMMYAQIALKTFAVRAAELVSGAPVSESRFPDNHAWVDFRGPPGTFPTYSAIKVLEGQVSANAFAGKVIFVGVTDTTGGDTHVTAASSTPMAGVEFQANALDTILNGFPLQPMGGFSAIVLLLLLAWLPSAVSLRFSAMVVLGAGVVMLTLLLCGAQLAFNSGTIVPIPDGVLALALGTVGAIAVESVVQRRQLHNLQELFDLLPSPVSDFFISYRHGQSELAANTLREGLTRKFGEQSVFMDTDAIDAGQQWPQRIQDAITSCRAMLVVIGPQWLGSESGGSQRLADVQDWVRREIEAALQCEYIAVVPVLHDGARVPSEEHLPDPIKPLAHRQGIELTGRQLEHWIEELSNSIHRGRLRNSEELQPEFTRGDAPS